jgi:hypothetical protein
MLSYSAPAISRSLLGRMPSELVGVAGFEPAASSSRRQSATLIASASTPSTSWSLSTGVRQRPSKTGWVVTHFLSLGLTTIMCTARQMTASALSHDVRERLVLIHQLIYQAKVDNTQ